MTLQADSDKLREGWYHQAFGHLYRDLYAHRDASEARRCLDLLTALVPAYRAAHAASVARPLLDLCCGAGRHAEEAAARGLTVVGFDLSDELLEGAVAHNSQPLWVRGDMKLLPFGAGAFHAVMNLFTSFGYFLDDDLHAQTAAEIARVLEPGGWLLWDHINPAWLRDQIEAFSERTTEAGARVRERRKIDETTRRVEKRVEIAWPDGEVHEYLESVRIFEPEEAEALFAGVGLAVQRRLGDYRLDAEFTPASPRQIALLRKR